MTILLDVPSDRTTPMDPALPILNMGKRVGKKTGMI
jgi:hypothetical protein